MNKYMILGHENTNHKPNPNIMERWMKWAESYNDHLVDFGAPLLNGHQINNNQLIACDKKLAGYMILQGESLKVITEIIMTSPLGDHPDKFSIYEIMAMK